MLHATVSLTAEGGTPALAAAAFHLKRGYYSTSYPSQSGSAGLFLEARRAEAGRSCRRDSSWSWSGKDGAASGPKAGWSLGRSGPGAMLRLGYVPSYVPWLCLGAAWHGRRSEPALFVSVELAPRLYR